MVLLLGRSAAASVPVDLEARLGERLGEPLGRGVVAAGHDVRELWAQLLGERRRRPVLGRVSARLLAGVGIGPALGQRLGSVGPVAASPDRSGRIERHRSRWTRLPVPLSSSGAAIQRAAGRRGVR